MENKDLLKHCKYYKGEKECPYSGEKAIAWEAEQSFVRNTSEDGGVVDNALHEYINQGLSEFNMTDSIPIFLKAMLYNRYEHWNECSTDSFKKWYNKMY